MGQAGVVEWNRGVSLTDLGVRASIVLWAFVIGVLASDQTDPEAPCTAVNPALTTFDM